MDENIKVLTWEDVLNAKDITVQPVDVPEWGGRVYVRTMNALMRDRFNTAVRQIVADDHDAAFTKDETNFALAAYAMCDKRGTPLNTGEIGPASRQLMEKSHEAMQRVINAAALVNGLSDNALEAAKNALPGMKVNGFDLSSVSPASSEKLDESSSIH